MIEYLHFCFKQWHFTNKHKRRTLRQRQTLGNQGTQRKGSFDGYEVKARGNAPLPPAKKIALLPKMFHKISLQ